MAGESCSKPGRCAERSSCKTLSSTNFVSLRGAVYLGIYLLLVDVAQGCFTLCRQCRAACHPARSPRGRRPDCPTRAVRPRPQRRPAPGIMCRTPGQPRPPGLYGRRHIRSEEHTSELQSLMRISYAVFCLKKKKTNDTTSTQTTSNS